MKLNNAAIPFIKLQRTDFVNSSAVIDDYIADINADYQSIESFVPINTNNILDIGCGVGLINVHHHIQYPTSHIWLLDKTELPTSIRYGYADSTSFYNSLDITKTVLIDNGVPSDNIHTVLANDEFTIDITNTKMDLVTSFLSWGFHYPVLSYLPNVLNIMNKNATLILDLRHQSDCNMLMNYFNSVSIITTKNKATRVACTGIINNDK